MSRRRILIDAGNTRMKWALVEDGQWRAQGSSDYEDCSALEAHLANGIPCYVASVASAENERQLAALLASRGIAPTWLKAEMAFADVKNSYLKPQQLGVDRWMGLIAARRRTCEPVLVVSAGTAMTVDALSATGEFLGGIIVAGSALMRQALQQGTARVAETTGVWQAFPRSTADAVTSGAVAALCGAIEQQHAHLAEVVGTPLRCLITGGDAGLLLPHLRLSVEHAPALVLEGIGCVAGEDTSR